MSSSSAKFIESLATVVGDANVLVEAADTVAFLQDWRGTYRGRALAVVRPATTSEVANVIEVCASQRVPIVPQGGNTGMCGGAIPDASGTAVVVALSRMNRVLDVDVPSDAMTVEAGCVLTRIQEAAAAAGRLFPLSLAAEGSCQIGGNLATNAGGTNVLRYGNARDLVLGLEVVLADGTIWKGLRALRKDNRGYDLKQLFIGAEGTLGIITRAVLKLFPRPSERFTALLAIGQPDAAVVLLSRLCERCGDTVSAYELISHACLALVQRHFPTARIPFAQQHPWYVLVDLNATRADTGLRDSLEALLAEEIEHRNLIDAVLAQTVAQANELWGLRESIPEATRAEGPALRSDIAVAVNAIPAFVARATEAVSARAPGAPVICFGHLGDGNLHFNVLPEAARPVPEDWPQTLNKVLYDLVDEMHGSFSAEHGIGHAKRLELERYKG